VNFVGLRYVIVPQCTVQKKSAKLLLKVKNYDYDFRLINELP